MAERIARQLVTEKAIVRDAATLRLPTTAGAGPVQLLIFPVLILLWGLAVVSIAVVVG